LLDEYGWSVPSHHHLNPGKSPYPLYSRLVLVGAVDPAPSRFNPQTVLCVASQFAECAIAVHEIQVTVLVIEIISWF